MADIKLLTKVELADKLGISTRLINNMMKDESLPFLRMGRRVVFREQSIAAWLGKIELNRKVIE